MPRQRLLEVVVALRVSRTLYLSQSFLYSRRVSILRLLYVVWQGYIGTNRAFLRPRLYWAESNYMDKVESLLAIDTVLLAPAELDPCMA